MGVEVYTLPNTDIATDQLVAVVRAGLPSCREGEVISGETYTALWKWINAETKRLHPIDPHPPFDPFWSLKQSPHWLFWAALLPDDEVRWTKAKAQTYFVVTGDIEVHPPLDPRSRHRPAVGWIELRRHTGKTFWAHISQVRPKP